MSILERAFNKRKDDNVSSTSESVEASNVRYIDSGSDGFDTISEDHRVIQQRDMGGFDALIAHGDDGNTIGDILEKSGALTREQVEDTLRLQDEENLYFGEAALKLKYVTHEELNFALARQYGYEYLTPDNASMSKELISVYKPFSKKTEALRAVRSALIVNVLDKGHQVMAILSPGKGEGKSYTAANLAILFSQLNKKTLLIDANFRSPRQHEIFNFDPRIGLSAILGGRLSREGFEKLPETLEAFSNVSLLGSGPIPPNPSELLGNPRLKMFLKQLRNIYDIIIIDTPSAEYKADVQFVSQCVDIAVVVCRKNRTSISTYKNLLGFCSHINLPVAGVIYNEF
ncbi:MAG: chain length determinant protein tyrosine kinase EpsG [Gammaproteobacteria bacterium]|nr:MAG: chain length determinant protein tyrosine kinase EpsG [Gammaproteobacteria bacterium]